MASSSSVILVPTASASSKVLKSSLFSKTLKSTNLFNSQLSFRPLGLSSLKKNSCYASAQNRLPQEKASYEFSAQLNKIEPSGSSILSSIQKPAVIAMMLASLLAFQPDMAIAASGGGRVGGKVSRQSYSSPSYSQPSYSTQTYIAPPIVPYYAPSPFFGGFMAPTVYIGGGGGIFGLLFFGLIVMVAINAITGFLGSSEDEDDVYTSEVTVMRVQVGLLGLARSLQRDLERIALDADTSSAEGLQYILSETSLSLLRHPDFCVYGRSTSELKRSEEAGESAFNSLSLEERGKFSEETLVNVGNIRRSINRPPKSQRFNSEYIVVTLIVAAEGKYNIPEIKNLSDLKTALSQIGSVPADRLQAVEVLWTPQDDDDTLSERELLQDYPKLSAL